MGEKGNTQMERWTNRERWEGGRKRKEVEIGGRHEGKRDRTSLTGRIQY